MNGTGNGGAGGPDHTDGSSPAAWTMNIELYSGSFEGLQSTAKQILEQVSKAKSFRDFPRGGGGGSGGGIGSGYNVTLKSPVEARIAALRREADDLEAGLIGKR